MLAEKTLLKTAYHFLLLLVGFDTLTYRKDYDRFPILVGHQDSFLAPLPGSEAPLVSGTVGERSRNSKFSMHHQDQSMERLATRERGSASSYP